MRFLPLCLILLLPAFCPAQDKNLASHDRPFFMPDKERQRLRGLIGSEAWAKIEYARIQKQALAGDGFLASFLYAIDGDQKYIPIAEKWLLEKYGPKQYWIQAYTKHMNDPNYFKGGQPGIPDVYYDVDISGALAFDYVHKSLPEGSRKTIEDGLRLWARYRMRCMDRWSQTPNLVFKPTYLVALIALALQDQEMIRWAYHRNQPWGPHIGGYFEVLQAMQKDGGPWHEASIYPVVETASSMLAICNICKYRGFYDGKDWFRHKVPSGATPRGLVEYYLDSAYPIEKTGHGAGQIRVATYGDGATNARGDLFLVNPAGPGLNMEESLIAAYNVSLDSRYGTFLRLKQDYQPNLLDRPPLPPRTQLPPAPSKVWPEFGLAMLRSDESPSYWTSGKAIAVFQVMTAGYGHDHRDKFGIMLHGANRLFYPDYNAIQYENLAIGWTRNTVAHNTMIVDEKDTRDAKSTGIRHDFTPDVKFLATSASAVYEGVDQTRALLLTKEYLLDVFSASSKVPHTYDYVLHSFGKVQTSCSFKPGEALKRRYWLLDEQQTMKADDSWSLDFVIKNNPPAAAPSKDGKPPPKDKHGKEWYDHTARLRLTMAAQAKTEVTHAIWGDELAKLVDQRTPGAVLDRLSTVVARRDKVRDTVFVATHEPYANQEKPQVAKVTTLFQSKDAVLVRVDGKDFTDYAAIDLGPRADAPWVLFPKDFNVGFKNYGWLRVAKDGSVVARGGWTHLARLPEAKGPLTLNGKVVPTAAAGKSLDYNSKTAAGMVAKTDPILVECPFPVKIAPGVARLFNRDRRTMTFTIQNTLTEQIAGRLEFDLPDGVTVEPAKPEFKSIKPGQTATLKLSFVTFDPQGRTGLKPVLQSAGRHTIPFQVHYTTAKGENEIATAPQPLALMVGPTLEYVYEYPKPYFLVQSSKYSARFDMFHGLCRFLADDDDVVRLKDKPLFTFTDGKVPVFGPDTKHAFTWPHEAPAHMTAHAYDRCRWQVLFFGDRLLFRMDPNWTQFEKTHFTIPGEWLSPKGPPRWHRLVAIDAAGKEVDVQPGANLKLRAAELQFPDGNWSLAFQFDPPQSVTIEGTRLTFPLGSLTRDAWSIGFCKPGELDAWRGKKK